MITDYAEKRFLEGQKVAPKEKKVAVVNGYNDLDLLRLRISLAEWKRNEILTRASEVVRQLNQTLTELKNKLAQCNTKTVH